MDNIDRFLKLPAQEQKAHARKLGLVKDGDERRTNMTEACLWTIRARELGLLDELFGIE